MQTRKNHGFFRKRVKIVYITQTYRKKQYESSIIKNHKITKITKKDDIPFKGYVASLVILDFAPEIKKKDIVGISSD